MYNIEEKGAESEEDAVWWFDLFIIVKISLNFLCTSTYISTCVYDFVQWTHKVH